MSHTATTTTTETYTIADIENVMRRFSADIAMIAQSTGAITEAKAADYAHDVEILAKKGYLRMVDVTLLDGAAEVRAAQYTVSTAAGDLSMSRPGGVRWPRVAQPSLRIVLCYTDTYSAQARQALRGRLKINWTPTLVSTSHGALAGSGGRDYASNGWGMQRKDFQ